MELNGVSSEVVIQSVSSLSDASRACSAVKEISKELEFNKTKQEQILIAAKELTANLVVHGAINGSLTICKVSQENNTGLALVSSDHGPGIQSISAALADDSSTIGSMGCGLGAVKRLMDEFDINSIVPETQETNQQVTYSMGGTTIVAIKWLNGFSGKNNSYQWGGISRPMPGYAENGDAYIVNETSQTINAVVIDGLGHGVGAQQASVKAVDIVKNNLHLTVEKLFPVLHEGLKGTRGAAITVVHVNKAARNFVHCGVGNVEARIFPSQMSSPVPRPGVVGSGKLPPLLVRTYHLGSESMLILNTDGISIRWGENQYIIRDQSHNPLLLSHYLLRDYGRNNDDATALVIKEGCKNVG